jgi:hypothetical protein
LNSARIVALEEYGRSIEAAKTAADARDVSEIKRLLSDLAFKFGHLHACPGQFAAAAF